MSRPTTTSRLISAYGEQGRAFEPWKAEHDRAMLAYEIETSLSWGLSLFETLGTIQIRLQSFMAGRWTDEAQAAQDELDGNYGLWLKASRGFLDSADEWIAHGHEIARVEDFRQLVLEAESLVDNMEFERGLPAIEVMETLASPANPRPDRYPA